MKKFFLVLTVFVVNLFGYNYNGNWINKSGANYNDPIKLIIKGNKVKPILIRGERRVALKSKVATNVGNGLFEAWGHGYKNLVLFIKPVNRYKLRVTAKKIDVDKKRVLTKVYTFVKKGIITPGIRKRFTGNFRSTSGFSAIKKISIREVDGKLFVRAWKNTPNGVRPLGVARAKLYDNKLHITWNRANLVVKATVRGYNYNAFNNRYNNLELSIKATNLNSGFINRQTMQLKRGSVDVLQPIYKNIKIGPVDVNLMINSY